MRFNDSGALGMSMTVLKLVRILNILYGAGITLMLGMSVVAPEFLFKALGFKQLDPWDERSIAVRALMVVGIAGASIVHRILAGLMQIVGSVYIGDPFITENATRIQSIAWLLLSAEILHLVAGALVEYISTPGQPFDTDWRFSLTPWVAILMLFVLARVFDHGARLREDLEGTV
jgi:hypothetical protein